MNPSAIEGHLTLVLIQWMIIIAAAWVFGRLAKKCHQPLAVGEIAAGILLGPSALGAIWPANWPVLFPHETQTSLQMLGKLGLIFLLFQVGMEFDYSHLRTRTRTITTVSIMGMVTPCLCGLAIGPWLHREFAPDTQLFGFMLFICIALSISALPIMGRILLEMKLERTALGAAAVSTAAIDDVVSWVLLGVATALVSTGFNVWHLVGQIAGIIVFFLFLQKIIGPALRKYWQEQTQVSTENGMPNSFLAVLLLCLFASCLATHFLGIFVIFGAFMFGVCLHQEPGIVKAWRDRFSGVVLVAFVPIFFTNTGLNTRIGSLQTAEAWLACGLVLIAAVAGKLGGCYLGARLTGQSAREAGSIAALMNTRALMALIAIDVGLDLKLLTPPLFTMLVIMALLTTAMTGPLLRWWLPPELRKLVPD
jgi:Kef-type K+ transport system membrane component KefB